MKEIKEMEQGEIDFKKKIETGLCRVLILETQNQQKLSIIHL